MPPITGQRDNLRRGIAFGTNKECVWSFAKKSLSAPFETEDRPVPVVIRQVELMNVRYLGCAFYGLLPELGSPNALTSHRDFPRTRMLREEDLSRETPNPMSSMLSQNKEFTDVTVGGLTRVSVVIDQCKAGEDIVAPDERRRPVWPTPVFF